MGQSSADEARAVQSARGVLGQPRRGWGQPERGERAVNQKGGRAQSTLALTWDTSGGDAIGSSRHTQTKIIPSSITT